MLGGRKQAATGGSVGRVVGEGGVGDVVASVNEYLPVSGDAGIENRVASGESREMVASVKYVLLLCSDSIYLDSLLARGWQQCWWVGGNQNPGTDGVKISRRDVRADELGGKREPRCF